MNITLQELIDIANAHFSGVPYSELWVFYSEERGEFFLIRCRESILPTHNNLDSIIIYSHQPFPHLLDSEICLTWREPHILAHN